MPNYIHVSNLKNTLWEKQLSNQEYQQIKESIKGKDTIAPLPATLRPVRTNTWKNFSKDFFLPTTLNHAIKVRNIVSKIFAIFASLAIDMLTFPIRLLTCTPRIISNAKQEKPFLYKYLLDQGFNKKSLDLDYVRVKLEWEINSPLPNLRQSRKRCWREENVNFIEMPTYEGCDRVASGSTEIH